MVGFPRRETREHEQWIAANRNWTYTPRSETKEKRERTLPQDKLLRTSLLPFAHHHLPLKQSECAQAFPEYSGDIQVIQP